VTDFGPNGGDRGDDFARTLGDIPDPAAAIAPSGVPSPEPPAERSPTRAERRRRNVLLGIVGVAWVVGLAWFFGFRGDLARPGVFVSLGAMCVAVALGFSVQVRGDERGLPARVGTVRVAGASAALLFLIVVVATSTSDPPFSWSNTAGCILAACILATGPLAAAAASMRRTFLNAPALRGAAIGAVCGLAGSTGIHAHCAIPTSGHVLIAHGFPIVLGTALGALLAAVRGRA
jgi:hypothetical protein